jgi:hypothetical protein
VGRLDFDGEYGRCSSYTGIKLLAEDGIKFTFIEENPSMAINMHKI